jgi:hypothetical protein
MMIPSTARLSRLHRSEPIRERLRWFWSPSSRPPRAANVTNNAEVRRTRLGHDLRARPDRRPNDELHPALGVRDGQRDALEEDRPRRLPGICARRRGLLGASTRLLPV